MADVRSELNELARSNNKGHQVSLPEAGEPSHLDTDRSAHVNANLSQPPSPATMDALVTLAPNANLSQPRQ